MAGKNSASVIAGQCLTFLHSELLKLFGVIPGSLLEGKNLFLRKHIFSYNSSRSHVGRAGHPGKSQKFPPFVRMGEKDDSVPYNLEILSKDKCLYPKLCPLHE